MQVVSGDARNRQRANARATRSRDSEGFSFSEERVRAAVTDPAATVVPSCADKRRCGTAEQDLASGVTSPWPYVYDPVGLPDRVFVVFDHQHRVRTVANSP